MASDKFAHLPLSTDMRIAVLLALSDEADRVILNRRISIPLQQTLASAWSTEKLANCRGLLRAGKTPPPILVTRYMIHSTAWYVVGDGNHRTVAAQEAGKERIDAWVGSEVRCAPERYRVGVEERALWLMPQRDTAIHEPPNEPVMVAQGMDPAFIEALELAGVRTR